MVDVPGTKLGEGKGIIPVIAEEIDDFAEQVTKFRNGEWSPEGFMAYRLIRGVYGQRQPDVHMVRVKIPQGILTAEQLEALGVFARDYAPLNKGHVTTRENIQFHYVNLEDTPTIMRILGNSGLSTREACGNTVRNVTGCPLAGVCADEPFDVTPYAAAYCRYFVRHPLTQKLPRKFKTAFSGCARDCAITDIHDMGFIPQVRVDHGVARRGFTMKTGGGLSIMARIGYVLYDFVPVEEYLKVTEAVLRIFNRSDELRKNKMRARIKFLIDRLGIDEFRKLVDEELKLPWASEHSFDPTPMMALDDEEIDAPKAPSGSRSPNGHHDPSFQRWVETNVSPQRQQGYNTVLVKLPLGDITPDQFDGLARIARAYAGGRCRLTAQQNLVFRWVLNEDLRHVRNDLVAIGLGEAEADRLTDVTSCPGTDSCKLGITSSMGLARALTDAAAEIEAEDPDPLINQLHIKISGCPNACGQHHLANIGFHGAALKGDRNQVPAYEIFLGGSFGSTNNGTTRIGHHLKGRVPAKQAPSLLKEVLAYYRQNRQGDETFNDFVDRVGTEPFEALVQPYRDVGPLDRQHIDTYIDWDKTVLYKLERGEGECAV